MKLAEVKIKGAKPTSQKYKLSDGGGLYLEVTPAGGKLWRYKYRFNGKEKLLSLGKYPDVSLKKAREKHQKARQQLADNIDPSEIKKQEKAGSRFYGPSGSWACYVNDMAIKPRGKFFPIQASICK